MTGYSARLHDAWDERGRFCARDADPCISRRHATSLIRTRPTSLCHSFIHTIKGHHKVILGVQRFQGAVFDSIERRAQRRASRHRALAEDLQFYEHHPAPYQVNRARGADGKVDDAIRDEWSAIVD